jgi:sugar phosphate isomerase/epimerase
MASDHGIVAGIHIHSGPYMTATGGLVARILEGMDTDSIGAYIDPGHMVLEGGRSGWKLGMDLLRDVTKMVAVKDFGWEKSTEKEKTWELVHMPLSEGMVLWPEVFEYLAETGFDGPVSLHSEYEHLGTDEIIEQTSRDLAYIKDIIAR